MSCRAVSAFTAGTAELTFGPYQHITNQGTVWLDLVGTEHEAGELVQAGLNLHAP